MKIGLCRLTLVVVATAFLTPPLRAGEPVVCPAIDPPALLRQGFGGQAAPLPGLRVFRDPVTGQLRQPTREEAAALATRAAETTPESRPVFEVVLHPDGMKTVDLQEALLASVVITRGPDGSVTVRCLPPGTRAAQAPEPARKPVALEEK